LIARHKKRGEEWDALNVIPMSVTDENMTAQAFGAGRYQILAESMSSSPTINCPPSALVRQIGWVEEGRISGSS
jgi:hypothetical protein